MQVQAEVDEGGQAGNTCRECVPWTENSPWYIVSPILGLSPAVSPIISLNLFDDGVVFFLQPEFAESTIVCRFCANGLNLTYVCSVVSSTQFATASKGMFAASFPGALMGLGLALAGVWAQEGADTPPVSHGSKFGAAVSLALLKVSLLKTWACAPLV